MRWAHWAVFCSFTPFLSVCSFVVAGATKTSYASKNRKFSEFFDFFFNCYFFTRMHLFLLETSIEILKIEKIVFDPKCESLRLFTPEKWWFFDPRNFLPKHHRKDVWNDICPTSRQNSHFSTFCVTYGSKTSLSVAMKSHFWRKMPKLRERQTRPEIGLAGRSARFWRGLDS